MTFLCKKTLKAKKLAEKAAHEAVTALDDAVNYVAPRAQHAADKVAEVVKPAFEDAREKVVPLVTDAAERVTPAVQNAYETVSEKVQYDLYPKLTELIDQAGDNPQIAEATKRSKSALAALKGDLSLPEPKVRKRCKWCRRIMAFLGIITLVGLVAVIIKVLWGNPDDGWSPQDPMNRADFSDKEEDWGENPFGDEEFDWTQMPAEADESEGDESSAGGYGEGAYVGDEPPEGFVIKGNERSMKYHVPEAAGYERTNADVWFNSEQAAQDAGFTRALR